MDFREAGRVRSTSLPVWQLEQDILEAVHNCGRLVLVAGFLLLSGSGSKDPNVFNYAMFDWRRLVAAPIVMVAGIVVEIVAIMGRFKEEE